MTFVHETDDSTREPSEPDDKDRGLELPYSPPEESQLTPSEAADSVPTDSFSNDPLSYGPAVDSELSLREAYLIRSYIQRIAAVVSLLPATGVERNLMAAGGYL